MHYKGSQIVITATIFLMVITIVDIYWIFTIYQSQRYPFICNTFNPQNNLMRKILSLTPFNRAINLWREM